MGNSYILNRLLFWYEFENLSTDCKIIDVAYISYLMIQNSSDLYSKSNHQHKFKYKFRHSFNLISPINRVIEKP